MVGMVSKAEFNKRVMDATGLFRTLYNNGVPVAVVAEDGGKCAAIKTAIEAVLANASIDSGSKDAIVALLGAAGGGKSRPAGTRPPTADELAKQRLTFVPFAAVVVMRNRNHHAYNIGSTYVMMHGENGADHDMFGMDANGCIISKSTTAKDGLSHLPRYRKSIRPATYSEICAFVDKLYR